MDRTAAARPFFGTTAIADAPTADRLLTAENRTSLDASGSTNSRQWARVWVPIPVRGHGWVHGCEVGDISQLFQFTIYRVQRARLARDAARAQVIDGEDPNDDKRQKCIQAEVAARTVFKVVADEYIQKTKREERWPATSLQTEPGEAGTEKNG
jgi:hypothetical protein